MVFVIGWTFTVATGLGFYSLPVYLNVLVHSQGFALTTVSYAVSAFFLVSAVVNIPLGRLIRRVQPRWVMLGGSVLAGLSLFLLGRVDAVWELYLVFTIFGCGFSASSYLPGTAVIVGLFDRDRARALALALTGGSVGGVVVAPLLTRIVDTRGLTATAPWLGLAYLILGGLPVVVFIRGHLAAAPAASAASAAPPPRGARRARRACRACRACGRRRGGGWGADWGAGRGRGGRQLRRGGQVGHLRPGHRVLRRPDGRSGRYPGPDRGHRLGDGRGATPASRSPSWPRPPSWAG